VPDARIIELLKRQARNGQLGKQPLAGVVAKLARSRGVAREFKAGAKQRACGAEARGIGIMWVNRSTVASQRDVPLRSASLVVNEPTGANDDLMEEVFCHDDAFLA